MALTKVQSKITTQAGSPSALKFNSATTAGNYLIAFVNRYTQTSDGSPAVTDTGGNTWSLFSPENAFNSGSGAYAAGIWYTKLAAGAGAGVEKVTYHGAASDYFSMVVYEVSGLDGYYPNRRSAILDAVPWCYERFISGYYQRLRECHLFLLWSQQRQRHTEPGIRRADRRRDVDRRVGWR